MIPNKACPVVLRLAGIRVQVLAFEHPFARRQLIKGTVEPGESPAVTALRELHEEAGIDGAALGRDLGCWDAGFEGQVWSFHVCDVAVQLPDSWVHHAPDDGGLDFRFFWQSLDQLPTTGWHEVHERALRWLTRHLQG